MSNNAQDKTMNLQPNGIVNAGFLSRLLFWWMNPFFRKGSKQEIRAHDMLELTKTDKSNYLMNELEKNWKKELEKLQKNPNYSPSLSKAIKLTHGKRFLLLFLFLCFCETMYILLPLLTGGLIKYFEDIENTPISTAYFYGGAMCAITIILKNSEHYYWFLLESMGWHIRVALCALMFKKALRLNQKSLNKSSTGQIVNLGSNDVGRFDTAVITIPHIFLCPLETAIITIILWNIVGRAAFAGIAVCIVLAIFHVLCGAVFGIIREKIAVITDKRLSLMSEIIAGIRIIKMYNWEKSFTEIIAAIRKKEIKKMMIGGSLECLSDATFQCLGKFSAFVMFVVAVYLGDELTVSMVFASIGLFNVLAAIVGLFLPAGVVALAEMLVSIKRIQTFLSLEEIETENETPEKNENGLPIVKLKNFTGSWDSEQKLTLEDISLTAQSNSLFIIVGQVGSGKSSILSAILKELPQISGNLEVCGKISYTSQSAWIFPGTVQENILFGQNYDKLRYSQVTEACALLQDFEQLPDGDLTVIGDRGVNLSGGQKARISLARAVYNDEVEICLLDDPFSAVDMSVGNFIFRNCVCGLLKNKIRIVVTHQLQFLKQADQVLVIKEGKVAAHGSYEKLMEDGTNFTSLLKSDKKRVVSLGSENDCEFAIRKRNSTCNSSGIFLSSKSLDSISSEEEVIEFPDTVETKLLDKPQPWGLGEQNEEGNVKSSVYLTYFRVKHRAVQLLICFILLILGQVLIMASEWWIASWTAKYVGYRQYLEANESYMETNYSSYEARGIEDETDLTDFNADFYINVTAAMISISFLLFLSHNLLIFYLNLTSGIYMHDRMFKTILQAPVRFFDSNSVGNILNRFSKDMGQIDEELPDIIPDVFGILVLCACSAIYSMTVNYFVIIGTIPLVAIFIWLQKYYLRTSRNIKRLEGATSSPVFGLLSATLQGLTTIRAFRACDQLEEQFHAKQDMHSASCFLCFAGSRWFSLRLDIICGLFFCSVVMLSIITSTITTTDAAIVGLSLIYANELISIFEYGVSQCAEMENLMTSVERVKQYHRISPEKDITGDSDIKTPPDWPKYGVITYDNVSFAYYKDGPNALKNVRLNIKSQEKIGIVGRTGAGKSSIISSLFRFSEAINGQILIDGIPTNSIGLEKLRNAISIIPQDPMLFTGTMRHNLDPFTQYEDEDLWRALEEVQLKDAIKSMPLKLDAKVSEAGGNFSVGQRQLVCLARAILRHRKILVIDEATANVDLRTDRIIQKIIREKFKLCTVLTIAHRLDTIIDSDRVLVMEEGRVKEFDVPYTLLQNSNGYFTSFVQSTGISRAEKLKRMAKEAYETKQKPEIVLPEWVQDRDRSYLSRYLPSLDTCENLDLETCV